MKSNGLLHYYLSMRRRSTNILVIALNSIAILSFDNQTGSRDIDLKLSNLSVTETKTKLFLLDEITTALIAVTFFNEITSKVPIAFGRHHTDTSKIKKIQESMWTEAQIASSWRSS